MQQINCQSRQVPTSREIQHRWSREVYVHASARHVRVMCLRCSNGSCPFFLTSLLYIFIYAILAAANIHYLQPYLQPGVDSGFFYGGQLMRDLIVVPTRLSLPPGLECPLKAAHAKFKQAVRPCLQQAWATFLHLSRSQ